MSSFDEGIYGFYGGKSRKWKVDEEKAMKEWEREFGQGWGNEEDDDFLFNLISFGFYT